MGMISFKFTLLIYQWTQKCVKCLVCLPNSVLAALMELTASWERLLNNSFKNTLWKRGRRCWGAIWEPNLTWRSLQKLLWECEGNVELWSRTWEQADRRPASCSSPPMERAGINPLHLKVQTLCKPAPYPGTSLGSLLCCRCLFSVLNCLPVTTPKASSLHPHW